jgi:hypothetical protein
MWVVLQCAGLWVVIWTISRAKSYTPSLLVSLGFPIFAISSLYALGILLGFSNIVLIQT